MDILNYFQYFLKTETPFMLMFVILFLYTVQQGRQREKRLEDIIEKKLNKIDQELQVMAQVWKVLLEKELEARK
jgi:hypothetical protein